MNNVIRVAMIIQQYHPRIGGAESQLAAVSPELQKQNVEVHVLTRRYPGLSAFEIVNGTPVHRLPIPGPKPTASIGFTLAAMPLLRKLKPDVIHAHELFSPTTTALLAKHLFGIPVVVTAHRSGALGDVYRLQHKTLGAQRLAFFRKNADAFIVISREINAELAGIGVPTERRVFIPNGVDTRRFTPLCSGEKRAHRSVLGIYDAPTALYAGRLAPEKRLDLLIHVWDQVRVEIPGAQLLVIGQGKEEAALRRIAGAGVRFIAATHNVVPYLQAADLFVLPSAAEGLSVALLEAMAVELSVLATAVGGNLEVIRHRENGWLVSPNDTAALREAIVNLLGDPDLRTSLGQRARADVVQQYEVSVSARRLRQLYERLVA